MSGKTFAVLSEYGFSILDISPIREFQKDRAAAGREPRVRTHAGSGGVGSLGIQIAKSFGAYVASTASKKNEDFLEELGVDQFINYKDTDFTDVVKDFDIVLDTMAGEILDKSMDVLKKGGRLVSTAGKPDEDKAKEKGITANSMWLDANGKANNHGGADSNFSFLTFLHGPRSCIGQKFAQAEFECLLAAWAGRFETMFEEGSPLAEGEPEIKGGITSKPKGGLWVRLRELNGW